VAEALSFEYYRQNGVQIRVARIFNTYGPRMLENDGRVVSNFIVQVGAASLFFPPKPTILCNELTSPRPYPGPQRKAHHCVRRWHSNEVVLLCIGLGGRLDTVDEWQLYRPCESRFATLLPFGTISPLRLLTN